MGSGEGPSTAPRHKVKIFNHFADQEIEVEVPEDRWASSAAAPAPPPPIGGRALHGHFPGSADLLRRVLG